jgi:preprotein translocase subunit SecA
MNGSIRTAMLPVPGLVLGSYPERRTTVGEMPKYPGALLRALSGSGNRRYRRLLSNLRSLEDSVAPIASSAMTQRLRQLRARLSRDGLTDALILEAFLLIGRASAAQLDKKPFDTQWLAARIMLDNRLAEMATGEGKTLAAGVCAATAALAGIPVHVVTANDYLVARDAALLEPLYRALGLSVGAVTQPMDLAQRRQGYGCDIVYCTAKELVFDYLRDGLGRDRTRSDLHRQAARLGNAGASSATPLLRGLCMAIVDEADSILIDEARVPLILSERSPDAPQRQYHEQAVQLASSLATAVDFTLNRRGMTIELTERGRARLDGLAQALGAVWRNRLHREETVCSALCALHLYRRDLHYVVREGAVVIIDESTGRLAPGRIWSRGLHRMIELKEGCEPGDETTTAAQMTYQRFFQRYLRLCGMSGTLRETHAELASVYGLPVSRVPLRRPRRRKLLPMQLHADREALWRAVVLQAQIISRCGRPVLIGTDSVADSEEVAIRLAAAGLPHRVLNARQDREEAQIVAAAGQRSQITVATNMAGRGTDIPLANDVVALGGLHVISCQHDGSRRIDRQLLGRCARQGDPGSAQTMLAADNPALARFVPRWMAQRFGAGGARWPQWLFDLLTRTLQRLEEQRQRAQRRALLEQDLRAERNLTFGKPND